MRNISTKEVYNTFLRLSRSNQKKPFNLRTNWEGFEESENFPKVVKLKNFFDRNEIVNIEDFFNAPYKIYEEKTYYDLDFYLSLNAIKVYNIFCTRRNSLEPDSDTQLEFISRGLAFIYTFCKDNNIKLDEYLNFNKEGEVVNSFINHLKEKNISIYNLFAFTDIERVFSKMDYQLIKFIIEDIITRISFYRGKFYSSSKAKVLAIQGLKKIEKKLNSI